MSKEDDMNKVNDSDLPGLFQSADAASNEAQWKYFFALKTYLIVLITASFFAYYSLTTSTNAIISASLFLITLGITIWLNVKKPEKTWYEARALAESVKTRSWRWMMCSEPYDFNKDNIVVSKQFVSDLKQILEQNRYIGSEIGNVAGPQAPITMKMKLIRSMPFEKRLEIYEKQRIENQATFYSKRAISTRKKSSFWFWVMISVQSLAILLLLLKIKDPQTSLPVASLAVCASSALSWTQAKKHKDLSASYALAAHEIVLIKAEAISVKSEKELVEFVIDSENAFSREHTQWVARKRE